MREYIGTTLASVAASMDEKALGQIAAVYVLLGAVFLLGWWYRSLEKRRMPALERFCPWSIVDILIVAVTYFAAQVVCAVVLHPWMPASGDPPAWVMSVATMASGIAALAVVFALLRKRYGLWPRDIGIAFSRWPSALLLAVVLFALVLALRVPMVAVFQYLQAGKEVPRQPLIDQMLLERSWWPLFLMAFAAIVVAPVWEEVAFRGFLQPFLGRWMGPRTALVLTAALFASIHPPYAPYLMTPILIFPLALALGYARRRTGGLAAPILLHALHNSLTVVMIYAFRGAA